MQNNTFFWRSAGLLIAIVVVVGGVFLIRSHAKNTNTVANNTDQFATTTLANGVTVVTKGDASGQITIQQVQSASAGAAPSLSRPATFSATLSADEVAHLRADEAASIAALKKDPTQVAYWLQLALDYKSAGDYQGAIDILNYLTKATPGYPIPYADLGDLYQNFVINYPKAEADYLQAITLNPKDINSYSNLYTLYRYQYKTNTTAAADIVARGLKANPKDPTLLQLQAQHT